LEKTGVAIFVRMIKRAIWLTDNVSFRSHAHEGTAFLFSCFHGRFLLGSIFHNFLLLIILQILDSAFFITRTSSKIELIALSARRGEEFRYSRHKDVRLA
jgi:hypothetical protein